MVSTTSHAAPYAKPRMILSFTEVVVIFFIFVCPMVPIDLAVNVLLRVLQQALPVRPLLILYYLQLNASGFNATFCILRKRDSRKQMAKQAVDRGKRSFATLAVIEQYARMLLSDATVGLTSHTDAHLQQVHQFP